MDISTPLIFVALFLIAFCSLFFVYKFGIKEKSYEEALAEQRQTTNALLGVKPKPKEKKNKKAAKKLKEKATPPGNETDDSENIDIANGDNTSPTKLHVEFKEEPEEVPVKEVVSIKKKNVKKVRPILIKKDKSPEKVKLDVIETPVANHFEENPPKDDFELLRSNSRDDIFKQETLKEKVVKEKKLSSDASPPLKTNKKSAKQQIATNSHVTESPPVAVEKDVEEKIVDSVIVVPQTNGVVGNAGKEKKKKKSEFNTRQQLSAERDGLIKLVRKAEFSKSEVQLLIDLLLNKQLEAPEVIDDWSEGKSDPVQKLKKQLAEKEKALAEEQEALLGVQAKLKEIRTEQQTERAQLQQKIRGLEEAIQNKQIEYQATNNRIQVNTQKIQQLQADLNAEILKTHKLLEDNAALQMQIQQYEVRISQVQDTDNIITALRNDAEDLSAQNQHLRLELQQSMAEKDHQQQQFIIQMNNLEKGLKQQIQQLEESHQDLERNLDMALRQENDSKIEISNLNTTVQEQLEVRRRLEQVVAEYKEDVQILNNENADNKKIITQLKAEIQKLKDEQASHVNGSSEESKAQEVEILNLTNELSSVVNELSSIKIELQQTEAKYRRELDNSNKKFNTIQAELEEQKKKNNKIKNEIHAKEQDSQKEFIQRLFPEIEDLRVITSEDWQAEFGERIRNYVNDLKKRQATPPPSPEKSINIAKLQAQIQHYKGVIDDTAGMLNRLETHIEKEEINWRCQLQAKDDELEDIRQKYAPLTAKILDLEKKLLDEIKLKEQIQQECRSMKSSQPQQTDMFTIEKLSEEVNRLREQLRVEPHKNGDANVCLKVPSIRNANICSNLGCQFLYCDGNSCHGN